MAEPYGPPNARGKQIQAAMKYATRKYGLKSP
jgi:hypothetical protein